MIEILLLVGGLLATPQRAVPPTPRLGAAAKLADAEAATVVEAVGRQARPVWFLEARQSQIPGVESVHVFFRPESASSGVRRGRVALVRGGRDTARSGPWTWSLVSISAYAQVPLPGRNCDQDLVQNDRCLSFLLSSELRDAEVLSIVRFVRSSPGSVRGRCSIYSISGTRDAPSVFILCGDFKGQQIALRRQGSAWLLVEVKDIVA